MVSRLPVGSHPAQFHLMVDSQLVWLPQIAVASEALALGGHDEREEVNIEFQAPVVGAGVQIRVGPAHMALPQLPQNEIARDAQIPGPGPAQGVNQAVIPANIDERRARIGADGRQLVRKAPPPPPPPLAQAVVEQGGLRRATQAELLERLRTGQAPQRALQAEPMVQRVEPHEPLIQRVQIEEIPEVHEIPMEGMGRPFHVGRPVALVPPEPAPEPADVPCPALDAGEFDMI